MEDDLLFLPSSDFTSVMFSDWSFAASQELDRDRSSTFWLDSGDIFELSSWKAVFGDDEGFPAAIDFRTFSTETSFLLLVLTTWTACLFFSFATSSSCSDAREGLLNWRLILLTGRKSLEAICWFLCDDTVFECIKKVVRDKLSVISFKTASYKVINDRLAMAFIFALA